ncbi:MAG: HupE/UreJ family protein [Ornithinimicrobium sp.]
MIVIGAAPAHAHDSGEAIALTVTDRRVGATALVAFAEVGYADTSGDGLIDASEVEAQEAAVAPDLVSAVREHAHVDIDGDEAQIIGAGPAPIREGQDEPSEYVEIALATGPHDGDVSSVDLSWSFTSPDTDIVLSGPDGLVTGQLSDDGTSSFSLGAGSTTRSFFASGIDHVRTGLDHMLFLVVLTFAVVGSTVSRATTWRVLALVTAFTLGHATSLCLAYFDVVSIPTAWVEPAISLSIVVAAVLALRGKGETIRPWIAAAIGLIHGLGFASSLSSMGLATSHDVAALAAFNIGIDVAQSVVVLMVVLGIWISKRVLAGYHRWIRIAVCGGATLVGLGWTASLLTA